ncbi:DNA repair protein XRCC1 [Armadillidium vulgare]|nr:DNA repair protein XRCC1 [Armadillidium vulgare]
MPHLNFTEVLTFSSEDLTIQQIIFSKSDTYLKWKSERGRNENQEYVMLKLEKLSSIRSLDIGNENSAFIEVLVSREEGEFKVLLVASSFMSPLESRNGTNPNRVRMFGSDKLNKPIADQKWDRIKIICTQPFIKNAQCGLTFVKVYGPEEKSTDDNKNKLGKFTILEDDDDDGPLSIGSFFAKRKDKESSPLTGAAAIRAASKMAAQSPEQTKILKRSAEENSSNAPDIGFYQLKKRLKESQDTEKRAQSPEQTTKALKRSSEENSSVDPNIVLNQIKKKMKESIGKERSASPSSKSETENQNKKTEVKKSSDSNSTRHRDKKSDSSAIPNSSKTPKKRVTRSFNKLMHDVVVRFEWLSKSPKVESSRFPH